MTVENNPTTQEASIDYMFERIAASTDNPAFLQNGPLRGVVLREVAHLLAGAATKEQLRIALHNDSSFYN